MFYIKFHSFLALFIGCIYNYLYCNVGLDGLFEGVYLMDIVAFTINSKGYGVFFCQKRPPKAHPRRLYTHGEIFKIWNC